MLYKHLREHFTSLAVKVDCNQVSYTLTIQEMDEELAITRANMIEIIITNDKKLKYFNDIMQIFQNYNLVQLILQIVLMVVVEMIIISYQRS